MSLANYKGKVILLDFWATWCAPCKVEIPHFIEFQEKYGKYGLQLVGISVDDTADMLRPYVRDMKMNYPVLQGLNHDDVLDAYGPIVGIPVSVLISRDGKICATHTGLTGKDILVHLGTNATGALNSTGTQVVNAINAHAAAGALIVANVFTRVNNANPPIVATAAEVQAPGSSPT